MHSHKRRRSSEDTYLETVDRRVLDFDFDKVCGVTLANSNVYACLVCGRFLQGRGKASPAYLHSVDADHHVFLGLESLRAYVLPEGYEVTSHLLDDIKYVVDPRYTKDDAAALDAADGQLTAHDLFKRPYRPGYVGLNNIRANDYVNAVVQAIAHVGPIRDLLLLEPQRAQGLYAAASLLVRKMYNPRAFKAHVSPHELLQRVAALSKKRFSAAERSDAFAFLVWFADALHRALGGTRKPQSSAIHQAFQGSLAAETYSAGGDLERSAPGPFLALSVELPEVPLFKDETKIPEVPLMQLLRKFDGKTVTVDKGVAKKYRLLALPPYLIINIRRGQVQDSEWNPTVVSFIDTNLDLSGYAGAPAVYDLVANIVYESGKYKVQLKDKQRGSWYLIEDLLVSEIPRERLFLHQSCVQIWEKRQSQTPG